MHSDRKSSKRPRSTISSNSTIRSDDISPFSLLRIALLPYDDLRSLSGSRLYDATFGYLAALRHFDELSERISDAIYLAVSTAAERDIRRELISVRKAIRSRRWIEPSDEAMDTVRRALPEFENVIARWSNARAAVEELRCIGEAEFIDELDNVAKPALRALSTTSALSSALLTAAPHLLLQATRSSWRRTHGRLSNWQVAILRYALRSSSKTSPFGSFTMILGFRNDATRPSALPGLRDLSFDRRLKINRSLIAEMTHAANGITDSTLIAPNPGIADISPGRMSALLAKVVSRDGIIWRIERFSQFRIAETVRFLLTYATSQTLRSLKGRALEAGLTAAQTANLFETWLSMGLLRPEDSISAHVEFPKPSMIAAGASPAVTDLHANLDNLATVVESIKAEPVPSSALIETTIDAIAAVNASPLIDQTVRATIVESLFVDAEVAGLGGSAAEIAPKIASAFSGEIFFDPHYALIRDHFIQLYGQGGAEPDVLRFLSSAEKRIGESMVTPPQTEFDMPALSGSRVPVTVLFQNIVPKDKLDGAAYVLNDIFPGAGWLSARHAWGDLQSQGRLRNDLQDWLTTVAAPAEPLDLAFNAETTEIQGHPILTNRYLKWPTEPNGRSDSAVNLSALRIVHDIQSDQIVFRLDDGRLVHPIYLGSRFPLPSWGPCYVLLKLTRPFVVNRSQTQRSTNNTEPGSHSPRQTTDGLVLRRSSWTVPSDYVRDNWASVDGFARYARVNEDFMRWGIPQITFVRSEVSTFSPSPFGALDLRKPQMFDARSAACMSLIDRLASDAERLRFVEMLPTSDQLIQIDARNRHVSEQQFEMILTAK